MERQDAILLKQIYDIEKKNGRAIYTADVINARVLPKASSQSKIEEFRDKGYLDEVSVRGANLYKVSTRGLGQMFAYRDIRIETMRFAEA